MKYLMDSRLPSPKHPVVHVVAIAQDSLLQPPSELLLKDFILKTVSFKASWHPDTEAVCKWDISFDPLPIHLQIEGADFSVQVQDSDLSVEGVQPNARMKSMLGDGEEYETNWEYNRDWRPSRLTIKEALKRAEKIIDVCPYDYNFDKKYMSGVSCSRVVRCLRGQNVAFWIVRYDGIVIGNEHESIDIVIHDDREIGYGSSLLQDSWTSEGSPCDALGEPLR